MQGQQVSKPLAAVKLNILSAATHGFLSQKKVNDGDKKGI